MTLLKERSNVVDLLFKRDRKEPYPRARLSTASG